MKIAIITLHKITNFGSMLQTYATQSALEKLGHTVEVIDFVPKGMTFFRGCWPKNDTPTINKLVKFIPLFICNSVQFSIMRKFMAKHIKLSPKLYRCYDDIINDIPCADAYVSGSDQVWNTQNNNPKDDLKAYYLGFVPDGIKKIAYAGSFGKNDFSAEESSIIRSYLSRYTAISVREDDGLRILERHGIYNGVHVVDPTLLLSPSEWLSFSNQKPPKTGYIFVYNLNRNPLLKDLANTISKDKGLRIINFADSLDFIGGAQNRLFNSAKDFITCIAYADIVLTDSFHGTAFSINLCKQFIAVKAPRYNSRLESILRQAKLLETRMVSNLEEGRLAYKQTIDYSIVKPIIEEARRQSINYIVSSLS